MHPPAVRAVSVPTGSHMYIRSRSTVIASGHPINALIDRYSPRHTVTMNESSRGGNGHGGQRNVGGGRARSPGDMSSGHHVEAHCAWHAAAAADLTAALSSARDALDIATTSHQAMAAEHAMALHAMAVAQKKAQGVSATAAADNEAQAQLEDAGTQTSDLPPSVVDRNGLAPLQEELCAAMECVFNTDVRACVAAADVADAHTALAAAAEAAATRPDAKETKATDTISRLKAKLKVAQAAAAAGVDAVARAEAKELGAADLRAKLEVAARKYKKLEKERSHFDSACKRFEQVRTRHARQQLQWDKRSSRHTRSTDEVEKGLTPPSTSCMHHPTTGLSTHTHVARAMHSRKRNLG